MAIINLGNRTLVIGDIPQQFDPFAYDVKNAYLIMANMTVSNPNLVFSFIRIKPLIKITGQSDLYITPYVELEIRPVMQSFYFPASSLFGGNGNVFFEAERLPLQYGFFDTTGVSVTLTFDNANTVKSWRN